MLTSQSNKAQILQISTNFLFPQNKSLLFVKQLLKNSYCNLPAYRATPSHLTSAVLKLLAYVAHVVSRFKGHVTFSVEDSSLRAQRAPEKMYMPTSVLSN